MQHPLCECPECEKLGRTKLATEVHHKIPFMSAKTDEMRQQLCYDWNNLMAVSKECHDEIHRKMKFKANSI